ncbi:MAG: anti-sigma factor antagonist [Nitrospinae bacterium]|nr:anti-sigma factor antagonist [Nitrospinota bacterium]
MALSLIKTTDGVNIVRFQGKLVAASLDELKEFLENLPLSEPVVLNMKQVNIIDSISVGYLVTRYRAARKNGAQFKLANLHVSVQKMLSMADLHRWFDIHEKEEDAVASIVELPQA